MKTNNQIKEIEKEIDKIAINSRERQIIELAKEQFQKQIKEIQGELEKKKQTIRFEYKIRGDPKIHQGIDEIISMDDILEIIKNKFGEIK